MTGELWILLLFFAFVAGSVMAAGYVLVLRPAAAAPEMETGPKSTREVMAGTLEAVGRLLPASESEVSATRKLLAAAGYRWPSAVAVFYGLRLATAVFGLLMMGWIGFMSQGSLFAAGLAGMCAAAFGYKLLDRVLFALIRFRCTRLRRALPAALDLIVLGVEAGQSLDQAIHSAGREIEAVYPDLGGELARVCLELELGKTRTDALRRMAERNQEPELRKVVNLLIETDRFGTSLGPVLRSHARFLRIRVRQQAQEAARKVGVKLVFPAFFLIFPSVLLVTLGPAALQLMEQMRVLVGD